MNESTMAEPDLKRDAGNVPLLEFLTPYCSVCGTPTEFDTDYFRCYGCNLRWSGNGYDPEWDNEHLPACGQRHELKLYTTLPGSEPVVCQLDEDHKGPHAGFNPAEITGYGGPPDWYRWDHATGERLW